MWVPTLVPGAGVSVSGTPDQRIRAIATVQRGRISRGQLVVAGIGAAQTARLLAAGRLVREQRGVFTVGHDAPTEYGAETSALLAVRTGAALSHWTAAHLWGLVAPDREDGVVHATVHGCSGGRPKGVRVHRSEILHQRDLRILNGLPLTSPARTLLDLAPHLTARELERAVDQMVVHRAGHLGDLTELLRRCGRHPGTSALSDLVIRHAGTTFTRSEAEERFLALVRDAQLPQPLVNARRHGFEVDFLWPELGIAVEIDGYAFHRGRSSFEDDRRRDAILKTKGIDVIRITWRQLTDEPLAVIARLAATLNSARAAHR
jgi:very-short-patch-repair endonuclease